MSTRLIFSILLFVVCGISIALYQYNRTAEIDLWEQRLAKSEPGPDQRPSDWLWERQTFPHGTHAKDAHLSMLKEAQAMRAEKRSAKTQNLTWEFAGPTNVQGRVNDIEFNPINPDIVYTIPNTGGVFKSTDAGATWFPVFDEQSILTTGDIAIDPVNPDVVYIGTGDPNGGSRNFPGAGIYKSTDAGATWQLTGLENTVSIGRVLVDPSNTQRVFVAAIGSYFAPNPERGVYRSNDGGATWDNVLFVSDTTGAIDLIMDQNDPDFLMAAMWERVRRPQSSQLFGPTGGIYTSTDGGDTWTEIDPVAAGLPNPETRNVGRIGLSMSASDPNIIYALYNDGRTLIGVYKTTDKGVTWTDADPNNQLSPAFGSFSWNMGQIRVHPEDPDIVYVMDVRLAKTTNGGNTWSVDVPFHVDFHALAFNPQDSDHILLGNDGGIDISTDGGNSWTEIDGLPVTQFYEIGLDATNPERLYGGTQDNSTPRTNTGQIDDWDILFGGDGFYVNVHPTNPNIIYVEAQFGFLGKSTNGGLSFNSPVTSGINSSEPTNWSTPVIMDPHNPERLYYGTNRVYRTENGAGSWTALSPDLTDGGPRLGTITTIAVAPTNPDIIMAGTDDSHVWLSTDFGATWNEITGPDMPYRWVTRVAIDPNDANVAYVTFSGLKWRDPEPHIFRTTDLGNSWTDISANLPQAPINAIAIDPLVDDAIYIGTDVGAYVSFDAGGNWEVLGTGMPLVTVFDMKIHPNQHFLVAGTYGRSMYKMDLSPLTGIGDDETPGLVEGFKLEQNFPNPFNPSTTIRYSLEKANTVSLKVFNTLGQEVRTIVSSQQAAGEYSVEWNGRDN
ncbi:MAG: FlgD immunoglobulin-like domain containing protein, partial [Calditrichota bacterium]